jgi:ADP-heptose:LPS heptosyltransferase
LEGRRILAVRPGALGDTLLALPAIAALRAIAGCEGRLEVVGTEPSVRLTLGPRHASRAHSIDRGAFRAFFQEGADDRDLLSFLREFDLVVAWSKLPLLRAKLAALGVGAIEAPSTPPEGVHASEHLYRSLAPLGTGPTVPLPELDLGDDVRRTAEAFLARHGLVSGRFAAIHPSSGSARKNWLAEGFREIAERARNEGLGVLWIRGEADARIVEPLARAVPAPVARELPLDLLASVLAKARVFFGNDSGVTHLAAAAGAPTIALFGPTDPRSWAPRGRAVRVVGWSLSPSELWGEANDLFDEA